MLMTANSQSRYEYGIQDEFTESLRASFIGTGKPADERYSPRIIVNDKEYATDILSVLKTELSDCASFDFSVAFVTSSGIQTLIEILNDLKKRNIPGRILTSTYLNFNDPDALKKLLDFPNIETRIYEGDLHAKGYFFGKEGLSAFIIGSSNLTQKALTCNKEWNVLFRSFSDGEILHQAREEFERLWKDQSTSPLSIDWIGKYESFLKDQVKPNRERLATRRAFSSEQDQSDTDSNTEIIPNTMQRRALAKLSELHQGNEARALLISATGTGKTYLSALDVRAVAPKRVLFIAHRKRILEASLESYERVLGDAYTYGLYSKANALKPTCTFAMVNTLAKHLDEIDPHEFDYIVIDEAHRTGAQGYREILEHLNPDFLLGMTATPSRTDGYDVYSLFNHVIAHRITLQDALENEMLAPFHYFGIADLSIDGQEQDDAAIFSQLTSSARAEHIAKKIEEYSVEKENRKGLIFCSRNDEAQELSNMLNGLGYRTLAISGKTPDFERNAAIERLESGEIEYILSVDILNEGIDIPSLNQIIMLRPTESAIVFVQQLGRGLRKHEDKEFTLVLDFIGNYQQNFLIPVALSGDRAYSKDALRRFVKEGSIGIPGCSTISFDPISEKRIFKALEEENFSDARLIKNEYRHLRQMLGRIPRLTDFDANEAIDPMLIIRRYDSYQAFLQKEETNLPALGKRQLAALRFLSMKIANGKRRADLTVLKQLLEQGTPVQPDTMLAHPSSTEISAVSNMLSGTFSTKGERIAFFSDGRFRWDPEFESLLQNRYFREAVSDLVEFGLSRNERDYNNKYKDTDFVLYQKYTREEVCRLLRWRKEPNYQNIGGYFHDTDTNTFPVFINYEKDPSISITTQYEDRFLSESRIIAISKSRRTLFSPEIEKLRNARENGMRCFLFVRKNKNDKNESIEFYFLGEMRPTGSFGEITMQDGTTSAVEIEYELDTPVRGDLYDYLTSNLDAQD